MEIVKIKGKKVAEIHFLTDKKNIKNVEVVKTIRTALEACYKEIPVHDKFISLIHTMDPYVKEKMGGVGGHASEDGLISLRVNPTKGWITELAKSVAHEYSHLTIYDVGGWKTVLDYLVMEGVAENFREEVLGGGRAPWTVALTEKEARSVLERLKEKFNTDAREIYTQLFFGSNEYKRWSGYTIGYFIVKKFREKHPKLKWKSIIRLGSSEILEKSGML